MADRIAVLHEGHLQQYAPPQEVYEHPSNAFVAGFVGETNFIEGTLQKVAGTWSLRVGDGNAVGVAAPAGNAWSDGTPATLAIRPEAIRIVGTDSSDGLPATVTETIYGGGTVACITRLATGQTITVEEPALEGNLRRSGDPIRVAWSVEHSRVFIG